MKIIAGTFRGHTLHTPKSRGIRPTSAMLRESVFNKLTHGLIEDFATTNVLDLFAGTGALGFEAISRGAKKVIAIDQSKEACRLLKKNAAQLKLSAERFQILRADSSLLGQCAEPDGYGLIFMDPPYGKDLANIALKSLITGNWLAKDAIVVIEETAKASVHIPKEMRFLERKAFGTTQVVYAQNTYPTYTALDDEIT